MGKNFSLEAASPKSAESIDYHSQILKIINEIEQQVRVIAPDKVLDRELHKKRIIDSKRERQEFEEIRKDIYSSFGVPADSEHTYIHEPFSGTNLHEQRALRAFSVLVDVVQRQAYYGEGRIDHNTLFRNLVEYASKEDPSLTFETAVTRMDETPPKIIFFKGFLSLQNFKEISDSSRKVLETPLYDAEGRKIDTAETWFLTGHSLPEPVAHKDSL